MLCVNKLEKDMLNGVEYFVFFITKPYRNNVSLIASSKDCWDGRDGGGG
jgi:hypothetical protein